ncbi:MAG: YdeI/OmpD-associated family protein [Myxococcales bacterium]|nr:YdeI/OmpD-associated family protein [Myxococcales bacterium]
MTKRSTTGRTGAFERVEPAGRAAWRRWLAAHHPSSPGVWLVYRKKGATDAADATERLDYAAAVEEALCFGWIDSVVNKLDALRSLQLFSPRKRGSTWSKSNKERVARLVASGLMTPVGLAKVEAARRDGSWTALDAVEALELPADLKAALRRRRGATAAFAAFGASAKKGLLFWLTSAKRPETRARRLVAVVEYAAGGDNPLAPKAKSPPQRPLAR